MAREDPQLKLRLTEEMKDRITEAARQSGRSVNAEIVSRLDRSFVAGDLEARIERLELEKKHIAQFAALSEKSRKAGDRLNHSAQVLMFVFADLIKQYADGDPSAIDQFIASYKAKAMLADFQMPEDLEDEEDVS